LVAKCRNTVAIPTSASLATSSVEAPGDRHPMSPYGDQPLLSRDALREHFGAAGPRVAGVVRYQPDNIRIHETRDPEVIVAEFDYAGTVIASGEPFRVPCVFVLRVRDGLIVESRDYIDHVGMARARGLLDDLVGVLQQA
jgi:ketosteroid isomerase-like protein